MESGQVVHPWGLDARGRLTYDAHGRVALQIARRARGAFASDDLEAGTPEEVQRAFDGYHAWFGSFSAEGEDTVVHRIEGSLFPNWEGQEQRRSVVLDGDELWLRSRPLPYGGQRVEFVTRWVRAAPAGETRGGGRS